MLSVNTKMSSVAEYWWDVVVIHVESTPWILVHDSTGQQFDVAVDLSLNRLSPSMVAQVSRDSPLGWQKKRLIDRAIAILITKRLIMLLITFDWLGMPRSRASPTGIFESGIFINLYLTNSCPYSLIIRPLFAIIRSKLDI